jgi:hypothetical protein
VDVLLCSGEESHVMDPYATRMNIPRAVQGLTAAFYQHLAADRFRRAGYQLLRGGAGHFGPMEKPEEVAALAFGLIRETFAVTSAAASRL